VNDPAVTIVVVMDSPAYQFHYGTAASAPVFHELAQQILEYLGVPHDQDVKSTQEMAAIESTHVVDDDPEQSDADLKSLFDEVNDLPADDPLRAKVDASAELPVSKSQPETDAETAGEPMNSAGLAESSGASQQGTSDGSDAAVVMQSPAPAANSSAPKQNVVVSSGTRVAVPSLLGQPVRLVIERAGGAGLGVQVVGSGIARQQVPAAGTMVPAGTQVVVRFGR
jgi:cell division protein FtsI (penicillin-binding protein 3)